MELHCCVNICHTRLKLSSGLSSYGPKTPAGKTWSLPSNNLARQCCPVTGVLCREKVNIPLLFSRPIMLIIMNLLIFRRCASTYVHARTHLLGNKVNHREAELPMGKSMVFKVRPHRFKLPSTTF